MQRLLYRGSVLAAALVFSGCQDATEPAASNLDPAGQTDLAVTAAEFSKTSKQSVKGQVERDLGHALERYSFNAHYLGNGTVGGRFHLRDMFVDGTEDITVHGRITCFTIEADGKTARLGGVIQSASQDEFVGTFAAWTVRDNGNSRKEPRDQATDLSFGATNASFAASHCRVGIPLEGFGTFGESPRNLKVRP